MIDFKKTVAKVVNNRNFSPSIVTALIVAAFLVANVFIYVMYAYLTPANMQIEKEDLSISDAAADVFERAKSEGKEITVTFCMSEENIKYHPEGMRVYQTAKEFEKKYPDFINIRYANIFTLEYDDGEGKFNPAEYQKVERKTASGDVILDSEGNPVVDEYKVTATSIIFECNTTDGQGNVVRRNIKVVTGAAAFVDFYILDADNYITAYNGEEYFTAMAYWVISNEHKTVYFTMGHGELPSTHLYTTIVSAGYYVKELNLRKETVPADAAFVVISNPKSDFERAASGEYVSEIQRLSEYADMGGSFYVIVDPIAKRLTNLEEFVAEKFGISFKTNDDGERLMVKDINQGIGVDGFSGFTLVTDFADAPLASAISSKISKYNGEIIVSDVAALSCDESLGAKALLQSSPSSSLEAGGIASNENGPFAVAAYSERENEFNDSAKLFFMPSIYFTANDAMSSESDQYANKNFLYGLFDELYDGDDMPYGTKCVLMQEERLVKLTLGASLTYAAILMAIPVALAAVGTVTIIRRKNR